MAGDAALSRIIKALQKMRRKIIVWVMCCAITTPFKIIGLTVDQGCGQTEADAVVAKARQGAESVG